jgi:hypothetical protein
LNKHADHFLTSLIDFIFRRPMPGLRLIRWGVAIVVVAFSGFAFTAVVPLERGPAKFTLDTGAGTPALLLSLLVVLGLLLIGCGLAWVAYDLRREARKQVLVVELRGLRDTSGQPLASAVPKSLEGRRVPLLVDIRQGADGAIKMPDVALKKLESLPHMLHQSSAGRDRQDLSIAAAGLAPVPFMFLMGVLLDDEDRVKLFDWDRTRECWCALDEADDGERLAVTALDSVGDATEAVVVVSVSYPEDREAIARRFPGLPVIRLSLAAPVIDHHWSAEKQTAWAEQFFDVARQLCATKVQRVHAVLAVPASVALSLGRAYDKRNVAPLTVYQYEKGDPLGYPWGIEMPVANATEAKVVRANG